MHLRQAGYFVSVGMSLLKREESLNSGDFTGKRINLEDQEIIAQHARPTILAYLHAGLRREAWQLYRATLSWGIKLGCWKFLFGFPLRACLTR
jgi:hypothetical protein